MLVDKMVVRAAGAVAVAGGLIFFALGIAAIGGYLVAAGVVFWVFTLNWHQRYQAVLDEPPAGFEPTGEVYPNPGSAHAVAVWHRGIRRVYVKVPQDAK